MSYSRIDPVFFAWAVSQEAKVYTHVEGQPTWPEFRNVYFWSDRCECFQIWVRPLEQGQVGVHAAQTETRDDEEFRQDWFVDLSDLETTLQQARLQVQVWMDR